MNYACPFLSSGGQFRRPPLYIRFIAPASETSRTVETMCAHLAFRKAYRFDKSLYSIEFQGRQSEPLGYLIHQSAIFRTACIIADKGYYHGKNVPRRHAYDERYHLHALGALYGGYDRYEKGYYTHEYGEQIVVCRAYRYIHQVIHGGSGKGNGTAYYRRTDR